MMHPSTDYPGTPRHQRVLRAIVSHYAHDPRALAVIVFGSLGRGNWDEFSDLDLDIVLADGVQIDVPHELNRLCESLETPGERAAVIVPKREDEGDVVFVSLLEMSIRFHPLATTSRNIVESMRLLWGRIEPEAIRTAAEAQPPRDRETIHDMNGRCVRAILECDVALQRQRLWMALEQLHEARSALFDMFASTRGAVRPLHCFEEQAEAELHERVGATVAPFTFGDAQQALLRFIGILEHDMDTLSRGSLWLSEAQRDVLRRVRERQAGLSFAVE